MTKARLNAIMEEFVRECPLVRSGVVNYYAINDREIIAELYTGEAISYDSFRRCYQWAENIDELMEKRRIDTEEKWRLEFGIRLYKKICEAGMSQCEFAWKCGISEGTIAKYVNGFVVPSAYRLKKMADILHCSPLYFMDF